MISPKICHCIHPFFHNYAPVSAPSCYCIGYSVINDTVSSYCTKDILCIVGTMISDDFRFDHRQEQEWAVESVPTLVLVIIFITVTI